MVENKLRWPNERKLKYILELQEEGKSIEDISLDMGYARLKNLTDFMSKQGYAKVDAKYVLKESDNSSTIEDSCLTVEDNGVLMDDKSSTDVIQANKKALEVVSNSVEDKYTINVLQSTEGQEKLINILNNHSEILDMLNWFREVKAKYPTNDLPPVFNIDYEKSKAVKTTVRVDEAIWEEFSALCKNKYPHLSKIDILSQILSNFIDENK